MKVLRRTLSPLFLLEGIKLRILTILKALTIVAAIEKLAEVFTNLRTMPMFVIATTQKSNMFH